jgi:hypothetical protein
MTDKRRALRVRLTGVDARAVIARVSDLVAGGGTDVERALHAAANDFGHSTYCRFRPPFMG